MPVWERVFAAVYDPLQARAERGWLGRERDRLLAGLEGRVLDLGAGTGANVAHRPPGATLVAAEPSTPMRSRLRARAGSGGDVLVLGAAAEALPFRDGSFDAVVATLVLCTVDDVRATLDEVRRVLTPGGRLVFLEHGGRAPGRRGVWQRRLDPIWTRLACGCHLDRDACANVAAAGFRLGAASRFDPPGIPVLLRPFVRGVATP